MTGTPLPDHVEQRVFEVFEAPTERRADLLDQVCAEFPEHASTIRERVARAASIRLQLDGTGAVHEPRRIGPFRVLSVLGEGGMGTVYLAEQHEPIERRVALKVIRPGMDSERVLARFETERQALGMMSHSCIARVFEAGTDERERPWFSMEYVEGEPITAHCERAGLAVRERLELFRDVCDAVQHAHQKGVIHRDLKPSNILVTEEGGRARPKVIDFGLARAMEGPADDQPALTLQGTILGTPEYMSPEQAERPGFDVDTRADIYSLGVVLCELLTGVLPYDAGALRGIRPDELKRRLRELEPRRPSALVATRAGSRSGTASTETTTSEWRGVRADRELARELRGELDWIVLKAIARDRDQRYQSAGELGADVGRFLRDEPVLAGPPSVAYRLRKLLRRYRVQVAAAGAVLLALVLGLAASTALFFESRTARRQAEASAQQAQHVTDFMMDLFRYASPSEARGADVPVGVLLHAGADRLRHELRDQPVLRAQLLANIGKVYGWLGLYEPSRELLTEALRIREPAFGPDDPAALRWRIALTVALQNTEGPRAAERNAQEVVRRLRERADAAPEAVASATASLAGVLSRLGDADAAEQLARQALRQMRELVQGDSPELAQVMSSLGAILYDRDDPASARVHFADALAMHERLFPEGHPSIVQSMKLLARNLTGLGDYRRALEVTERALREAERLLGEGHPTVAELLLERALALRRLGRDDAAVVLLERALRIDEAILPPNNIRLAWVHNDLGAALMSAGRYDEARAHVERAVAIYREADPDGHPHSLPCAHNLAEVLWRTGDLGRAEEVASEALDLARRLEPGGGLAVGRAAISAALVAIEGERLEAARDFVREALAALDVGEDGTASLAAEAEWTLGQARLMSAFLDNLAGNSRTAERAAAQAFEHLRRGRPGDSLAVAMAHYNRAWAHTSLGEAGIAEPFFIAAIEMLTRRFPHGHPEAAFPLAHYGQVLIEAGRFADALPHVAKALDIRTRDLPENDTWRMRSQLDLGRTLLELGRFDEAEGPLVVCHKAAASAFGGKSDAATVALRALVDLYERWQRPDDAARYRAMLPK